MVTGKYSYGRQVIEQDDIDAVVDVLRSDWLTQGPCISLFEEAVCEFLGAKYATAVCNGTAALHLAALALEWEPGDIVLTSPVTFLASANCALYVGAVPDFVDIDPDSYTIDVSKLGLKVEEYQRKGKQIKAVVAVDFAGHPCDWKALRSLADRFDFQLVGDSCHALGAKYEDDASYAAKYADVVALSFHPVKHITTGEGGALLTNASALDARIKMLRSHGVTRDPMRMERNEGPWYHEMHYLGWNYRITDFQCALGVSQLKKLPRFLEERRRIASYYDEHLAGNDLFTIPRVSAGATHAYHLYPLQVHFDQSRFSRREYFERLSEKGIMCQVHYIPVHLQPYYRTRLGYAAGDFPIAEKFYQREVSIPLFPGLVENDLEYIVRNLLAATKS